MSKVKGGKISSKLAFVRDQYGEVMLQNVINSLDSVDRLNLKIVLDSAWYPSELNQRLLLAICKVAAGGDESIYYRMGRYSAELAFTTDLCSLGTCSLIRHEPHLSPMQRLALWRSGYSAR